MMNFKNLYIKSLQLLVLLIMVMVFNQCKEPASLNAIIITDVGEEVGKDLQTILENTGLFDADISSAKSPNFSDYDVVILNVNKTDWSADTKEKFLGYVNSGGGVVALAGSAFAFDEEH